MGHLRFVSIILLISGVLGLAACSSRPPSPTEEEVAWKPFELGSYHRPVTTDSPEAQMAFDQGMIWAFAFNHDEAVRAFDEARRLDPKMAMAAWGIALVHGPHINNPTMTESAAEAAWKALGQARALSASARPVEQALIEALGARYAWPNPEDRTALDLAYAEAMADVARRFPDDADVATLYAEALMDTRPWAQWTRDGKPEPGTAEVLASLERALALMPEHPGANHLSIHALEASPQPERAAAAAERLRELAPDASHLVHMPAHIDVRLGDWSRAVDTNKRAMEADRRYAKRQKEIGFYRIYMAHNPHFLSWAAMMQGRRALALESAQAVLDGVSVEQTREAPNFLDAFRTAMQEARKRFGQWDAILAEPLPPEDLYVSRAHAHFVRAVALASLDRPDEAEAERAVFAAALERVPADWYWGANQARPVLAVGLPYVDGEIAYRRGRLKEAIVKLREAVALEDALTYDEPPAWTTPSRHALGAVYLAAGQPAAAAAVYGEDLRRFPENGWSLLGESQALAAQGKTAEAAALEAQYRRAWKDADAPITTSCLCVKAAAGG
jgi:tetratricopeptide (TPR) repeat protein